MSDRDRDTLRLPPQNLLAERSLLGALLLSPRAYDDVIQIVRSDQFYSDVHAIVFDAIGAIQQAGGYVDPVTVAGKLDELKKLEEVGGVPFVAELLETVPHAAHAIEYAKQIRRKWMQRELVQACENGIRRCYERGDVDEAIARTESEVFAILEHNASRQTMEMGQILAAAMDRISARMELGGAISGISTGFSGLDLLTNGLQQTELIVLAARPAMGKTAFVCNICDWAASNGTTTAIFSLEQSRLELAERFLAIRSRLDGHKLRSGRLEPDERHALLDAIPGLEALPLLIADDSNVNVSQIEAVCRRLKRQRRLNNRDVNPLGLVVIDYLQLIQPSDKRAPREQQIAEITRRLKGMAKLLDVPVVALSQLNRGNEKRLDKRPVLSDLRESGAIEQDADIVMFLHRPEVYNPSERPGVCEVIVAKHRSGPVGVVNLAWRSASMRFEDLSPVPEGSGF